VYDTSFISVAPSSGINMENGTYTLHVTVSTTAQQAAGAALITCQFAEPCGVIADTVGGILIGGMIAYDAYAIYSKGGKGNVAHDYVRERARQLGGDYCSALKALVAQARQSGDSKLFNDAKATYKQDCRGY
jgi:uncharacterized membrane protein YebE (DUF533 family)